MLSACMTYRALHVFNFFVGRKQVVCEERAGSASKKCYSTRSTEQSDEIHIIIVL